MDRPAGVGWIFDPKDVCYDCTLPDKDSNYKYNYNTMKFTGTVIVTYKGASIPFDLTNITFENIKMPGASFAQLIKESDNFNVELNKNITVVGAGPAYVEKKSKKKKVTENAVPFKEEIQILKEVGAAEAVNVFDNWQKTTIGELKAQAKTSLECNAELTIKQTPYFIGMHRDNQYIIVSTPSEHFEKQWPIFFKNERVALFVFTALLAHPKAKDSISQCAFFPLLNITKEDDSTECILVVNALQFLNSLPHGENNDV